ncbi:target of Myb protein 1 isoform X8 [Bubalus bubalis]|uniref:target of Myb protein 1 isoform X8 n=1 Tax=Bubalus bubalis TaxID=89462 RepID=UPI001D104F4D|nr:target of Myb protein 1 isoform X8 [Bubalus bubalis]
MDFLLGNPFSSPVGQRIEKATDGSLQSEDWALNMEICDIINETEEGCASWGPQRLLGRSSPSSVDLPCTGLRDKDAGPKDAFRAVKKRIVGNKNFHEVMLALTIGKLRSELEMVSGNVRVMSEMLTELVPTQTEPADLELLQELNRTCRAMQQRVLELIPRIANEQLTEELLIVNDNLNNVFLRHERFERLRTGQTTKAPSEAEAAPDLIDMGPDPVATGSLSSQLAEMNLGSSSVRAGLQSLEASGRLEDEFDMFALTRGSSLADQRKEVKYEAPQATDGLAGALDARQQSTGAMGGGSEKSLSDWMVRQGMIPVTQACLMEDIEKWLSTDVGNNVEEPKGVTSEEFDKFLEERAKVADRLPNLSSPSTEGPPGPPPGTALRKKTQEKDDDMLFAL